MVEQDKSEENRGRYLHPEAFGLPPEMKIGPRARLERKTAREGSKNYDD